MKNITVIAVGNIKENYFTDAINEYAKRIFPFASLSVIEIKEERLPDNPKNTGEIQVAINKEGKAILNALPKNPLVIALCIEGRKCSSRKFAELIDKSFTAGRHTVFIIGSTYGLSEEVKARADIKLSFSDMTFPHRLMRVILFEQLYRGLSILNNGRYHN